MARKRKRDWPQRVYRYAVTDAQIPESLWSQAKLMQALWNRLCEMHAAVRVSIDDKTSEPDRKEKWVQFNVAALAACKASGLTQECDVDVYDRFTKACVAAARDSQRGWPKPRGLSVSIRHRYGGGGTPLTTLVSERATRVRVSGPLSFDASTRTRSASKKCRDGRRRLGVFQLNSGDHIRFAIQQHEPINPLAIVKSVRWVGRRSVAFGWKWWIIIQTEEPATAGRAKTGLVCAIDVGWRKRGDALRVGYLVDDAGRHEEILLPLDFSTKNQRRERRRHPEWEHSPITHDELRVLSSLRDTMLEDCKSELREVLTTLPAGFEKMRGRGLMKLLRELPDSEIDAIQCIIRWKEWDRPRFMVETRARARFAGHRVDVYRNIAARLAKAYDTIYVESLCIKRMIEDGDKSHALNAADTYHQIAATADFLKILAQAAKKHGALLVKKDAMHTTSSCCVCGVERGSGPDLILTCQNGHAIDQDENAARNLLSQTFAVSVPKPLLRRTRREAHLESVSQSTVTEE